MIIGGANNGDGNRVKGTAVGVTTVYINNHFEWSGSTSSMQKYYYAGGVRVAVRTGASTLNFSLNFDISPGARYNLLSR